MGAKAVELILLRHFLSRLPFPATLVDAEGIVVYVNAATERMLGLDLESMGEVPLDRVKELLDPRRCDDAPMDSEQMPLSMALHERRPRQYRMIIHDLAGVPHRIVTTAVPETARAAPSSGR